jgi:hypothetical protein
MSSYDAQLRRLEGLRRGILSPSAPAAGAAAPVAAAGKSLSFGLPTGLTLQQAASNIVSFFFFTSALIFIIFLILVFIHFTITPVFKLGPNDPGFVTLDTASAPKTAWMEKPADSSTVASVNGQTCDFTVTLNVLVSSKYSSVSAPRVLLYRDETPVALPGTTTEKDLYSLFKNTNLLVYVDSMKNDLHVSAMTSKGEESITPITNIPIQTPFNLSIVYMPTFIEVYIDGKLQATRILSGSPMACNRNFFGPPATVSNVVKVGQLSYVPFAVNASKIRSSGSIPSSDFFKNS